MNTSKVAIEKNKTSSDVNSFPEIDNKDESCEFIK